MKLSDMALHEEKGWFPKLTSFMFMRLVSMRSGDHYEGFIVLGVPPWRELTVKDIYDKTSISVYP